MSIKTDRNRVTDHKAFETGMDKIYPEKNIVYFKKLWERWYVWIDNDQNDNPSPTKTDWSFEFKEDAKRKAFELKEKHSLEFGPCML
ncbi:hypothetical protein LCGC14_1683230 [marine sediment metagenome]|uniref:Uncharacterized protein n=1 Tax=marine sediment metagenome TaxID=412755 RepID=A0A0F9K3I5_9ZZZZ|nr:hypothetical protein [Candidatus Scalindua sp.]